MGQTQGNQRGYLASNADDVAYRDGVLGHQAAGKLRARRRRRAYRIPLEENSWFQKPPLTAQFREMFWFGDAVIKELGETVVVLEYSYRAMHAFRRQEPTLDAGCGGSTRLIGFGVSAEDRFHTRRLGGCDGQRIDRRCRIEAQRLGGSDGCPRRSVETGRPPTLEIDVVGAGQGEGVLELDRGDERLEQARAAAADVLSDRKGRRAGDDGAVHNPGIAGVVKVIGVAGGRVYHRRRHGRNCFTGCQQNRPARCMCAERMAAHYVGQWRAASGNDHPNGVEDAALGLVQDSSGDIVERQAVRELTAMADNGGRVAGHAGSVSTDRRLNGIHGAGFGGQAPFLDQVEKRPFGGDAFLDQLTHRRVTEIWHQDYGEREGVHQVRLTPFPIGLDAVDAALGEDCGSGGDQAKESNKRVQMIFS